MTLALIASVPMGTTYAQSDEVVELFERGLDAYRLANYEEAERLFAQAHALEPLADLSYNHARTLELLGRFGDAADVYARFLEEAPASEDRAVIETRIRNLRARQARVMEPSHAASVVDEEVSEGAPEIPDMSDMGEETDRPGPSLAGPLVLMAGGLALGAGGVATGLAGTSAHETASDPLTDQTEADAENRRATTMARTTTALFVLGGVVFAAGVTWLVVKIAGGGDEAELSLQIAPAGVALHGEF